VFQPGQYISLDYANQSAAVCTVGGDAGLAFDQLSIKTGEPLGLQFAAFLDAVETRNRPKLSGEIARKTLEVALAVLDKIELHAEVVGQTISVYNQAAHNPATGWKP
jgi:hypothetical protein